MHLFEDMASSLHSLRETAKSANSLVCLLQALKGQVTTVELRNEASAKGLIVNVDGFMNVKMMHVTLTNIYGQAQEFCEFFIQGKQIRFVHIPDSVDIVDTIDKQLKLMNKKQQPPPARGTAKRAKKNQNTESVNKLK